MSESSCNQFFTVEKVSVIVLRTSLPNKEWIRKYMVHFRTGNHCGLTQCVHVVSFSSQQGMKANNAGILAPIITLQTDLTRWTPFQWQIGGRGGCWAILLGYKALNDGLYLLFQAHLSLTLYIFHGPATDNPNNLCIHGTSAFTLIIHEFDFWSQDTLFPRCFSAVL